MMYNSELEVSVRKTTQNKLREVIDFLYNAVDQLDVTQDEVDYLHKIIITLEETQHDISLFSMKSQADAKQIK